MDKNLKKYDVVILGGGTSGCSAAYNCSKIGLKTLLVEKNNFLGGLMTGGLVVPVMKSSVKNINCDFYHLLVRAAKKFNSQITYSDKNDGWFNPEMLKIVFLDILTSKKIKNNLDILFETDLESVGVTENKINKINLVSNFLSIPIVSKYYIDSSGSGKLAKLSGCSFLNDNNLKQQKSLRFILGNVDTKKFSKFILKVDSNRNITNTYQDDIFTNGEIHFTTASTSNTSQIWQLDKFLKQGVKDGILKKCDREYFQIFSVAGGHGQVAFNCPKLEYSDDPYKNSTEIIDAYMAINRMINFTRVYLPGFSNAILTNIASITGSREDRRVKTKYIYTSDDLLQGKTFLNPVLESNYGIDIHSSKGKDSSYVKVNKYQLPIESLMSFDIENLFVTGKLIGADFKSHSALRVQKSCMQTGEAAAKYIAGKV